MADAAFDRAALKAEYGVPWYPVIDRERCSGCGTCHDYCLFSVYFRDAAKPAGRARARSGAAELQDRLPACARLCPEGALMFPFCQEAELNGEVENPVHRSTEALDRRPRRRSHEAVGGVPQAAPEADRSRPLSRRNGTA